jgi:hypothetical protein
MLRSRTSHAQEKRRLTSCALALCTRPGPVAHKGRQAGGQARRRAGGQMGPVAQAHARGSAPDCARLALPRPQLRPLWPCPPAPAAAPRLPQTNGAATYRRLRVLVQKQLSPPNPPAWCALMLCYGTATGRVVVHGPPSPLGARAASSLLRGRCPSSDTQHAPLIITDLLRAQPAWPHRCFPRRRRMPRPAAGRRAMRPRLGRRGCCRHRRPVHAAAGRAPCGTALNPPPCRRRDAAPPHAAARPLRATPTGNTPTARGSCAAPLPHPLVYSPGPLAPGASPEGQARPPG